MAIDNGWNFNRDDVYNDRCYANVAGAVEVAIKHPEMVSEQVTIENYPAFDLVQISVRTDGGRLVGGTIMSKRNIVWFTYPNGENQERLEIPTGKILLEQILEFIADLTFSY